MDEKALMAALTKWATSPAGKKALTDAAAGMLSRPLSTTGPDGKKITNAVGTWITWGGIRTRLTQDIATRTSVVLEKGLAVAFDPKAAASQVLDYVRSGIGRLQ